MDIETIFTILASLGIGGIVGSYLQHLWNQKRETESKIQTLNVKHYESTLVWMRIVLNPKMVDHFNVGREDPILSQITNANEIRYLAKKRLNEFYYSSVLFSPDEVLKEMKKFILNPTEETFIKSAIAMRKDLWKKKTRVALETLSLE